MPEPALRAAFDGLAQRLDRDHDPQWHPLLLGPDDPRAEAEWQRVLSERARRRAERGLPDENSDLFR